MDSKKRTALHFAVSKGHVAAVERLVGYGADMNVAASNGNTLLHEVLRLSNMTRPSNDSPEIKKVG